MVITWESTFQPAFTPVVHCWSRPQSRAFSNGAERWTSYFRRPLHKPCLEGTTCTSISGTCALQTPWALHFRKCRPSSSLITILDLPCLRTLHLDCSSLVIIYCNYIFSTRGILSFRSVPHIGSSRSRSRSIYTVANVFESTDEPSGFQQNYKRQHGRSKTEATAFSAGQES